MEPAVQIQNLSKWYALAGPATLGYRTLRDAMSEWGRNLGRPRPSAERPGLWALRDLNLTIQPGEVLGLIGRNGAGKSTLLKVLSRITEPTSGQVALTGRVGALLEVGTGFHPELTGRENIYLNGAILGMRRREIASKFDDIVAFAEVERFLDLPVKRYSSGMFMRLAFAVAAHLETEILLVDEVLAVGDAAFQAKCLGKMNDVAEHGRTVVFVSHQMSAIENLCKRVVWLDGGQVRADGLPSEVIPTYLTEALSGQAVVDLDDARDRRGNGKVRVRRVELFDDRGRPSGAVRMGDGLRIRLHCAAEAYRGPFALGVEFSTAEGTLVSDFRTTHVGFNPGPAQAVFELDLVIPRIDLYPRTYVLSPWATDIYVQELYDYPRHSLKLQVEPADVLGTGADLHAGLGIVHISSRWEATATPVRVSATLPISEKMA